MFRSANVYSPGSRCFGLDGLGQESGTYGDGMHYSISSGTTAEKNSAFETACGRRMHGEHSCGRPVSGNTMHEGRPASAILTTAKDTMDMTQVRAAPRNHITVDGVKVQRFKLV